MFSTDIRERPYRPNSSKILRKSRGKDPGDRGRCSDGRADETSYGTPELSGLRRDLQHLFEAAEGRWILRLSSGAELDHRADDNEESGRNAARDIRRADEAAAGLLRRVRTACRKWTGPARLEEIYTRLNELSNSSTARISFGSGRK